MKKLILAASLAASLLAGSAATAATFIQPWTTSPTGAISVTIGNNGLDIAGGSTSAVNGNSTHAYNGATGMFEDTFDFFLPTGFAGASAITTLSGAGTNDLLFTGITFNSATGSTATGGGVSTAHVGLQPITLGGTQHLVIRGTGGPDATYGGTATFILRAAAVPEPASWALMMVGFGGLGAVMRAKRRGAIAAAA